jgi:hypothetical protein
MERAVSIMGSVDAGKEGERKRFFFEKKKQKTFAIGGCGADGGRWRRARVVVMGFARAQPILRMA